MNVGIQLQVVNVFSLPHRHIFISVLALLILLTVALRNLIVNLRLDVLQKCANRLVLHRLLQKQLGVNQILRNQKRSDGFIVVLIFPIQSPQIKVVHFQ